MLLVEMQLAEAKLYTDGACLGNPGPGGYAALLRWKGQEKEICGGAAETTNNRMELTAVIEGLAAFNRPVEVDIYSDSKYVIDGIEKYMSQWLRKNWRTAAGKPVKNKDLWMRLNALVAMHQINWFWVKGHAGHVENEHVDELAQMHAYKHKESASG